MNSQLDRWCGKFGDDYTIRNGLNPDLVRKRSISLNRIIGPLQPISILEVGCNVGMNLIALAMFMKPPAIIVGTEPNDKARRMAEIAGLRVYPDIGQDLLFFDGIFDLVFTCGVLIHCSLPDVDRIVYQMKRIAKTNLLFMEYFSEEDEGIKYRDEFNLLWKRNWPKHFERLGLGKPIDFGYLDKSQGFDRLNWWVYKK